METMISGSLINHGPLARLECEARSLCVNTGKLGSVRGKASKLNTPLSTVSYIYICQKKLTNILISSHYQRSIQPALFRSSSGIVGGYRLNFNAEKDIPDLSGKVFFITGGTAGLGKQTLLTLAKHGSAHIYFTGRNQQNADLVVEECKDQAPSVGFNFIGCDQTSLSSVDQATRVFITASQRLDVLICNAGVMAPPAGTTKDGYEIQFGINHLAHALIIKALLPVLQRTAAEKGEARIIIVSSQGFKYPPPGGIVFKDLKSPQEMTGGRWLRYGQSKLANVVYALELSKRYPDITCVYLYPGAISTDLSEGLDNFRWLWLQVMTIGKELSLDEAAYNSEWAATTEKKNLESGSYYEPVGVLEQHNKFSGSSKLGEELWEWSHKELEVYGNGS